eukprot:s2433_g8.t1
MSLAGCCTVPEPSVPCVPCAPCGPAENETSAAAELMSRCQQMHEDLGKLVREEQDLLFSLSLHVERLNFEPETRPRPSALKTPPDGASKESNRHSENDAGDLRREVRFGRHSYGPQAYEPPPPLMMALPMKPDTTVETLRPIQPGSSPYRGRKYRGDSSKGTATSRLPEAVNNTYSINGITSQPIQVFRSSFVEFIRSNYSSVERQQTPCRRLIASFVMFCAWLLDRKEPERNGCLARAVRSSYFALLSTVVILANAVVILYATDYEMQNLNQPTNAQIRSVDLCLAGFYVVEVLLKLIVHKLFFFWNSEWRWNLFDFSLVLFAIVENVLAYDWMHGTQDTGVNLNFLRLFRLCKIVKILRIFRTLKFFSELRLMLDCMIGSLLNVIWCIVMLVFVMYVFALFVQQLLASHLIEDGGRESEEDVREIQRFFGSVGMTLLTLFQACTSGVDWKDPFDVLRISGDVLPAAFLFYVAFVFISVWNIITSTFVEKALKLAQPDIDLLVMEQQLQDYEDTQMLAELFSDMLQTDEDGVPRVGLEEFRHLVESSDFRSYLQTRGIDIKNAETFFKMLVELHGEPTIDAITFANACVRMKGAATSIDLQTVMYTTHLMNKDQRRAFQFMYSRLRSIESMLRERGEEFDWDASSFQSPKSQPNLSREWSRSSPLSALASEASGLVPHKLMVLSFSDVHGRCTDPDGQAEGMRSHMELFKSSAAATAVQTTQADVIVYAGDATTIPDTVDCEISNFEELEEFVDWFKEVQPDKPKIFIPGNHDTCLDDSTVLESRFKTERRQRLLDLMDRSNIHFIGPAGWLRIPLGGGSEFKVLASGFSAGRPPGAKHFAEEYQLGGKAEFGTEVLDKDGENLTMTGVLGAFQYCLASAITSYVDCALVYSKVTESRLGT